jgi:hypothetical protein
MTILLTGLLAGLLDGAAAILLYLARGNKRPGNLFRYIASAVFGQAAFAGGRGMILMGVLFHFLLAISFVVIYFRLYHYIPWLQTQPLAAAAGFGLLVWMIMNLVIVPLSRAAHRPFSLWVALINILILMIAIGLPAAYLAR